VIHPDGFAVNRQTLTFMGTYLGSSPGTYTETVVMSGPLDLATHATNQTGFVVIGHGTGGLAGIHGFGTTAWSGETPSVTASTALIWFGHADQQ
jgi:hypothetical protein